MSLDKHTSERTSVGYVLQLLTEEAIRRTKKKFIPNAKYHDNFIMPDALIPGIPPKFSIHVTCTGADNSFSMKRWRYVDEILQLRSVYGNSFKAVNVMFGPVSGYQKQDLLLVQRLFDHEVIVEQLPKGLNLFHAVIEKVSSKSDKKTSQDIAKDLLGKNAISTTIELLSKVLKAKLTDNTSSRISKTEVQPLLSYLRTRKEKLGDTASAPNQAFWKRSLLRFLAIPPNTWPSVLSLKSRQVKMNSFSEDLIFRCKRAKLIVERKGIVSKLSLCNEVEVTLKAGLNLAFLKDLKKRVCNDPRRINELLDLWDDKSRAQKSIEEFICAINSGRDRLLKLIEYSILKGGSPKIAHHRAHVLDIINVLLGWSQNRMQKGYSGPGVGVVDPIRNLIPRTKIALQSLAKDRCLGGEIAKAILEQTWELIYNIGTVDVDDLVDRYLLYRVYCLTKGSSINPLETFVDETCVAHGWHLAKSGIQCIHPLTGKTKTVFSAAATKNSKKLLVKCLFGDTGSDHKAEEMEARMRIIRTCDNPWKDAFSIFVADGKWAQGHITALRLSGWDNVVAVDEFNSCIAALN